jgi:hypothetical protein
MLLQQATSIPTHVSIEHTPIGSAELNLIIRANLGIGTGRHRWSDDRTSSRNVELVFTLEKKRTGAVGMEQLSSVCIWGEGMVKRELSGVGGEDQADETGELWGIGGSVVTPLNRTERD